MPSDKLWKLPRDLKWQSDSHCVLASEVRQEQDIKYTKLSNN